MNKVRVLILGTGNMAGQHARLFKTDPAAEVVAGVDVDGIRARVFCDMHGIPTSFGSLDEAIAWGEFDAVANVTPDGVHHPTTMRLLAAGKHVFCEKPLAPTYELAAEMADAAEAAGVVAMVNLSYRNVAALQKARAMVLAGEIGEIRHVEASYRQSWLVGNHWGDWRTEERWLWRLSERHGSKGVLGDVGIHILDFTTFAIGMEPISIQARLRTFHKAPGDRIGDYPLDANDSAVMSVDFENGALGIIHTSRFMTGYDNMLKLSIYGTDGALELEHATASTSLRACTGDDVHRLSWRMVPADAVNTNYQKFIGAILSGTEDEPTFRRAAELQRVLDMCSDTSRAGAAAPVLKAG